MTYRIALAPAAARQLRKFDPQVRRRIQAALELIAAEPRPPAATRLVGGSGEWRVRTADYRILYEIEDNRLLILGLRIGHAARFTRHDNQARRSFVLDRRGGGPRRVSVRASLFV
jgi:mRNA interferase RelE/StbE